MKPLADEVSPPWLLAARVELRRGAILERLVAPEGSQLDDEDSVIFAAIEMLRAEGAPKSVFLLTERHVHLYEANPTDPLLATVLVAAKATNLGLLLPQLRRISGGLAS